VVRRFFRRLGGLAGAGKPMPVVRQFPVAPVKDLPAQRGVCKKVNRPGPGEVPQGVAIGVRPFDDLPVIQEQVQIFLEGPLAQSRLLFHPGGLQRGDAEPVLQQSFLPEPGQPAAEAAGVVIENPAGMDGLVSGLEFLHVIGGAEGSAGDGVGGSRFKTDDRFIGAGIAKFFPGQPFDGAAIVAEGIHFVVELLGDFGLFLELGIEPEDIPAHALILLDDRQVGARHDQQDGHGNEQRDHLGEAAPDPGIYFDFHRLS